MRNPEYVENAAVAGGKNTRVKNIEVKPGQNPGDRGKKPGPILQAHHD